MNTDFRLSTGYFTHAKTQKLSRRLGDSGVLAHIKLLSYAAQNRPSGKLTGMDADDIAIATGYTDDIDVFIRTLLDLRLLDEVEGVLELHDWAEHNNWAAGADDRTQKSRSAAATKWGVDLAETNRQKRSERLAEARQKGRHTEEEWLEMKAFFQNQCVRCGKAEPDVVIVKDHIVPIYQGGSDGLDNLQPLCKACNSSKGPENKDWRTGWLPVDASATPALDKMMPAPDKMTPAPLLSSPSLSSPSLSFPDLPTPNLPTREASPGAKSPPAAPPTAELDVGCLSVLEELLPFVPDREKAVALLRRYDCAVVHWQIRAVRWRQERYAADPKPGTEIIDPASYLLAALEKPYPLPGAVKLERDVAEGRRKAEEAAEMAKAQTTAKEAKKQNRQALDQAFALLQGDPVALEDFEASVIERAKKTQFNRDSLLKNGKLHETVLRPIRDALLVERGLVEGLAERGLVSGKADP